MSLAMSGTALAQDAAEDDEARQETVTVTGSRIARADFVSNSPVATVGAEQFDLTGTVNTEGLLNTLPQTVPGLDRTSNNPGGGIATVDLRGLGAGRTLVLVDGKRVIPSTGGGVVDINNIPSALIERVEVVTGGASAVYGSDAVSGVVNFILKDDFEGAEFTAGYEAAIDDFDAQVWSANATLGGNFADDRGNAVISLGYTKREELFQGDRDFSFFAQSDDRAGGLTNGGSSGVPQGALFSSFSFPGTGSSGIFNEDGTIRSFITSGDNADFYNYAPENYIQLPQERFQINGKANYQVNDEVEVYASAFFADNVVPQQLAPTPIFEPRGTTIQVSLDGNPFIAPSAQQIISDSIGSGVDTDGDGIDDEFTAGAFGIRRRLEEVGPRIAENSFASFQIETGVTWDISDTWELDLSFSEGRTRGKENQSGNIDKNRFFQALLLADADGDGNVDVDAAGNPTCADTSSNGALTGSCVPINIYGQNNISQDAADFITTLAVIDIDYSMTNFNAVLAGDTTGVFELPGGPIGLAFGAEYREEAFDFAPSQAVASGSISGFNGAPAVTGGFDVMGFYGEAYLPILSDVQFADILALELAYRVEDYSTAGSVEAYKIAGEWAPDEQLRFRASLNTAVRAPSISELFSPQGEGFPGSSDPCSSAGSPQDAALTALCVATGVPAANVGAASIDLPSGQVRQLSGGNPDLQAEEAETLTVGFVASPNFVPGLTFSVDYFDIEIEDVINAFGGGANNVISTCYGDVDLGGVGSPFCNAITRGGDGLITQVSVASQNVSSLSLNGWDVLADYEYDAGKWGLFGIDYVGTITEENTLVPFEGGTPLECAGAFGTDCDDPQPEYKHRLAAKWANGPYTAQLLWRHIGGTDDDEGLAFTPAVTELDAENYFDISGSWDINENLTLTGGIDNVMDTQPPILGDNQEQANTFPATYDVFGRTVFVRATARF